jgi:CBS domain-containing protein
MHVRDVMVAPVVTVKPSATVQEAAKLLLEKRISATPVLDDKGQLVGIVSEGDLLHRAEAGTERTAHGGSKHLSKMTRSPPNMSGLTAAKFRIS